MRAKRAVVAEVVSSRRVNLKVRMEATEIKTLGLAMVGSDGWQRWLVALPGSKR